MIIVSTAIVAGIGFAGSYAAVHKLALKKGFGNFAYVFPIGIDAGICVLLALDLLLTWIRIPFPLLRQTAWLLTAATIAFNGAAAWPDPLGVGMHGVIPVLFIVAVEAARHAIGRIADITADKHMEGVRLTRWLLSPVPTFLLWRRMKLWELRSYEQVIKLEQERLVYRARLHSRFGRAWRRKAPVESLIPLRLARYGVPLAETAPAGLAAAGIQPIPVPSPPQAAAGHTEPATQRAASALPAKAKSAGSEPDTPAPALSTHAHGRDLSPSASTQQGGTPVNGCHPPTREQPRNPRVELRHARPHTAATAAVTDNQRVPSSSRATPPHQTGTTPSRQTPQDENSARRTHPAKAKLTMSDRYYLAWQDYRIRHGTEPSDRELSTHLAAQGLLGRGQQPVSPANLRRHFLRWRIYSLWANHRAHTQSPAAADIARGCARHGLTRQYNQPITAQYIEQLTPDFERRWKTLNSVHEP
ncbi:DUF2637 domain-containing protein [Streptomyces sp. CdTB01]|uniref:DUF2637 domain-containing protein n=1 Tax=Streptomyces sp. CdTB01 TaxID=1725411 RepID=UPI001EF014FE|nr:DUF2637 domain-containing protein [Streptomyces sp. CdTB01]